MANLGLINKNPGNLKDPSTGEFRVFNDESQGYKALVDDLEYKKQGKSSHIKPGGTILDLATVWAPASDNNVPANWANNVAKTVGVDPGAKWSDIPTDKLAKGIQVAEGTTTPTKMDTTQKPTTGKMSLEEFGKTIQQKYPEYAGKDPTLVGQKTLDKYPQYADRVEGAAGPQFPLVSQKDITPAPTPEQTQPGANQPIPGVMEQVHQGNIPGAISSGIRKFGNFITGGGTETLGNAIGTLGGLVYTKGKETLGMVPKGTTAAYDTSAPSVGETTGAAVKTVAAALTAKGLGSLATKAWGYAGAKTMTKALPYVEQASGIPAKTFATLSRTEQLNLLGQSLKGAQLGDAEIIGNAIKVLKPDASWLKTLLKYGGLTLVGEQVLKRVFGDRIGSAVSTVSGLIK